MQFGNFFTISSPPERLSSSNASPPSLYPPSGSWPRSIIYRGGGRSLIAFRHRKLSYPLEEGSYISFAISLRAQKIGHLDRGSLRGCRFWTSLAKSPCASSLLFKGMSLAQMPSPPSKIRTGVSSLVEKNISISVQLTICLPFWTAAHFSNQTSQKNLSETMCLTEAERKVKLDKSRINCEVEECGPSRIQRRNMNPHSEKYKNNTCEKNTTTMTISTKLLMEDSFSFQRQDLEWNHLTAVD